MLERHKLLMGRTQDRAGQNNGSIGVFWRSFNGIIGHIRYMFRGPKITHNHGHSSLYENKVGVLDLVPIQPVLYYRIDYPDKRA